MVALELPPSPRRAPHVNDSLSEPAFAVSSPSTATLHASPLSARGGEPAALPGTLALSGAARLTPAYPPRIAVSCTSAERTHYIESVKAKTIREGGDAACALRSGRTRWLWSGPSASRTRVWPPPSTWGRSHRDFHGSPGNSAGDHQLQPVVPVPLRLAVQGKVLRSEHYPSPELADGK